MVGDVAERKPQMSLPIVDALRPYAAKGDHDAIYEMLRDYFISVARQCDVKAYVQHFVRVRAGVLTLQGMPEAALRACLIRASDAAVIEVYSGITCEDFMQLRFELAILFHTWGMFPDGKVHSIREVSDDHMRYVILR
jgi:hypothetical protein